MVASSIGIRLNALCLKSADGVKIEYELMNGSSFDLFAFDAIVPASLEGAWFQSDPNWAYISHDRQDYFIVKRSAAKYPDLVDPLFAKVPFARLVLAGSAVRGSIELPSRIREFNSYYPDGPESTFISFVVRHLRFVVGIQPAADEDSRELEPGVFAVVLSPEFAEAEVSLDLPVELTLDCRNDFYERA